MEPVAVKRMNYRIAVDFPSREMKSLAEFDWTMPRQSTPSYAPVFPDSPESVFIWIF
jgi:hypothetical protein